MVEYRNLGPPAAQGSIRSLFLVAEPHAGYGAAGGGPHFNNQARLGPLPFITGQEHRAQQQQAASNHQQAPEIWPAHGARAPPGRLPPIQPGG